MKNLTSEMIEKAKTAKTAEELLEIAKANDIEMTADEAAEYFAQLNPASGELSDDDLDNVAGGCGNRDERLSVRDIVRVISGETCKKCGSDIGQVCYTGAQGYVLGVWCNNCSDWIVLNVKSDMVEILEHR